MSRDMKKGVNQENGCSSNKAEKVVVAVKESKEFPKTALHWALTHVVKPGDFITLLVVVSSHGSGRKSWSFPRFAGDCAIGHKKSSYSGTTSEQKSDITDSYSQLILQLQDVYDPTKINVKIKIVSGASYGAVSVEAKRNHANWVVLDRHLKHETKRCMEELQCNIVVMKRSKPKVLRLNLLGSPKKQPEMTRSDNKVLSSKQVKKNATSNSSRVLLVTPSSSPETFTTATDVGTSSVSSSDHGTSPFFVTERKDGFKKEEQLAMKQNVDESSSDTDSENFSPSSSMMFQPWMAEIVTTHCQSSMESSGRSTQTLLEKLSKRDDETGFRSTETLLDSYQCTSDFSGDLREMISLSSGIAPSHSPPLCSICQHKAPVFGKPPRWFTYAELELATGEFSQANFLGEGEYGSVHRGVLSQGQPIAVKQHKLAICQGDQEFCSAVEVLSCAQHRNVVTLIGFCIEDGKRLLVYEYICNQSLDFHLYGRCHDTLPWNARQKVAVGAARGLRYLHEECRVGCIVHRDMRPNNILITHDFEPLVGDFGLARWQPGGDKGVETRVIGTIGYLAPEYAESGQITEKTDVFSFGVVLLELVTGRKAIDINRPKGRQCLTEWARPLLEACTIDELVDPRLRNNYSEEEVYCMLRAASLCISCDPQARPRMSQVLHILEGDATYSSQSSTPRFVTGSQNRKIRSSIPLQQEHQSGLNAESSSGQFSSKRHSVNSRLSFKETRKDVTRR